MTEDVLMINFYPKLHENALATKGEYIFVIDRSGLLSIYALHVINRSRLLSIYTLHAIDRSGLLSNNSYHVIASLLLTDQV